MTAAERIAQRRRELGLSYQELADRTGLSKSTLQRYETGSIGSIPLDNNYAEQAIRPFTIGRKNFVLIESDNGAKASAILYSLVETAKANQLNTYKYFELLLTEIPKHADDTDLRFLDDLMPWSDRVQRECPSLYKKS